MKIEHRNHTDPRKVPNVYVKYTVWKRFYFQHYPKVPSARASRRGGWNAKDRRLDPQTSQIHTTRFSNQRVTWVSVVHSLITSDMTVHVQNKSHFFGNRFF